MSTKSHQLENAEMPKLRFREFSDRWDKTEIGRVLKIGGGKDYKHLKSGNVPVFGTGGYMLSVDKVLYSGESVMIGRKGTIDKPFYYNGDFWTVDTLFYTYGFNGITPKFTSYIFQKINWKKYNEASGVPSLSKATIEKIKISIPTSLIEQQKVSEFLESADKWIENLKDQKESFESYKKGMIKKILSQEIRFKDDKGKDFPKWAEKKIGDIFKTTRGNVLAMPKVSKIQAGEYQYPVYSSQTTNNGLSGYYKDYLFEDCITWTTDGANAGDVKFRMGKFYCTNVCGVLKSNIGYANVCVAEIFNAISKKYVSYVGNPKLMNNVVSTIKISIPTSVSEQEKISSFLTSVDKVIQSKQQQITQAELWKKGLMQGLFVYR